MHIFNTIGENVYIEKIIWSFAKNVEPGPDSDLKNGPVADIGQVAHKNKSQAA